ncbi:glycosyltransferase family 90 protein [Xylariomycetidae sp. FL2044]|nr:glycosyltransferase family 90 protein [Xylariomycetidae sp. FL2044]
MVPSPRPIVGASCSAALSIAYLCSRYYKSAAFERPIHFSILTLFLCGLVACLLPRYLLRSDATAAPRNGHGTTTTTTTTTTTVFKGPLGFLARTVTSFAHSQYSLSTSAILFCAIVARTLLYWRVIRTIHCSWDGLQSFLPFFLAVYDATDLRLAHLPKHAYDAPGKTGRRYAIAAFLWGVAATDSFLLSEQPTSAICPGGWPIERLVPLAQLVILALDAVLISRVRQLRQHDEDQSRVWSFLGTICFASTCALAIMAFFASAGAANYRWNFHLGRLEVGDLLVDSAVMTVGIVSGIYLLGMLPSTTIGLLMAATNYFVYVQWRITDGIWTSLGAFVVGAAVFVGTGSLLQLGGNATSQPPAPSESLVQRNRHGLYALGAFLLVFLEATALSPSKAPISPRNLVVSGRTESDTWIARASQSKSLQEAVFNYKKRYGIHPPPHFDKWYEYATSVESPIIDTFDQIDADLAPFWGVLPSVLRQRTTHLLENPHLSMGGLIIEDGKIEISPYVPGTHRWMVDVTKEMMEPFAQWLPDMQLAFNLDDECRVSVPYDRMEAHRDEGAKAKARAMTKADHTLVPFSSSQTPAWDKEYLDIGEDIWKRRSPWFFGRSKSFIFYELISTTCPADAPVNKFHWWNRKTECKGCTAPHMKDGLLSNWTLSGDLCHQPDLAYMHGFAYSPSAMAPSNTLFPVFSQSRAVNFADVLYPSPWNFGDKVTYDDEKALPWEKKLNSVFWRGASSDGFAIHGSWQTFLRARFVHLATKMGRALQHKSLIKYIPSRRALSTTPSTLAGIDNTEPAQQAVQIDVSFVGNFRRCDERDCASEHTTFYGSPTAEPPPSVDFQETWQHRHLVDLDGAAFSGRFLPFLKSASLPYRAALFRTWWEERIHAWRHFVPLDVRLGDLWPAVGYMGSAAGDADAQEIARAGQDWAKRVLRKEDMRVYMFRLLLEWGRLVDDRREEVGFGMGS